MKKEYLELGIIFLFVYVGWRQQFAMAKHAHRRRTQNFDDCYHCPPGFGVVKHCNRHHNTKCSACAPGHYSGHYSSQKPCYPCSMCGDGLYVAHKCTETKDTVCDSCHTYKGPHNEDYYERCVEPTMDSSSVREDSTRNSHLSLSSARAKDIESVTATDLSRGVPTSIIIASGVAIAALAVVLIVTCIVIVRRRCKRVDNKYPYQAVATKEAIML